MNLRGGGGWFKVDKIVKYSTIFIAYSLFSIYPSVTKPEESTDVE